MAGLNRSRAREWSRMALALGLLFGSLPVAGRIFLGAWSFSGAAEISCCLLILAIYLHLWGRRQIATMPDSAAMLDEASRLAAEGRIDRAIVQLSKTIRRNPRFWQAFQYRGELYLGLENSSLAIQDFTEAIRLAPNEAHLYVLRERACRLLDARSCP
jgi:cytochrome c-type biogenesis protein CcmH/NrfG